MARGRADTADAEDSTERRLHSTVNIDETTYMFSPKVLDRANVIEFHDVDLGATQREGSRTGRLVRHSCEHDLEAVLKSRPARRDDYLELPADAR